MNGYRCPTSPIRGSEKLNDLLGNDTTDAKDGAPASRLNEGACGAGGGFGGTTAGSAGRAAYIATNFLKKGYGTNYATSWYLVRSHIKVTAGSAFNGTNGSVKGLGGTVGPLTRRRLENSRISSNTIPFIGDAAAGDLDEAVLTTEIPGFVSSGSQLAESYNDGPSVVSGTKLAPVADGTSVAAVASALQDTRDWFAWHGTGSKKHANIAMADGSVRAIPDLNGDGFLNPGHIPPSGATGAGFGYTSGTAELDGVYSGGLLDTSILKKGSFE
ncbi:hypothetical protein MNBD_PLANCTO02-954 [hydrothermal vent metagenome]|uniref:Uncharacterized protein n=1 Tax=hydrothermal vent metagenome TaxID=652676 RepID=A0A3B1D8T0_9ZZZZ